MKVSFKEAAIRGLAPDKGLFFPEYIPQLDEAFIKECEKYSNEEMAYHVIHPFIEDEIPEVVLRQIIKETLCFDFPIVEVEDNIFSLELYHGPTLAFKDVGARFMSRCLRYFLKEEDREVAVLVATSGDTGGAVASGFYGVDRVKVIILYPSGKVSAIQEKQLTALGKNIRALEVKGTFDDCQAMVKQAFVDEELDSLNLTSANSINIARWLPQMFYYFIAYRQLKHLNRPLVVSVPSGNLGNICAGLMAQKMGLPIQHFVAATNVNDTVPRFMQTQSYSPHETIETLSNAMDVSNPSNFVRILELFSRDNSELFKVLSAYSFTDEETLDTIEKLYKQNQYLVDPHGAVGYLGVKRYLNTCENNKVGVFLETAHPVKFPECIEKQLGIKIATPKTIESLLDREKVSIVIETYDELKSLLHE